MMRSAASARRWAERSARIDHNAMGEDGNGEALDVVGNGVVAAFEQGQRLHGAEERLRAARADAEHQRFVVARLLDDGQHVVDERVFDGDRAGRHPAARGRLPRRDSNARRGAGRVPGCAGCRRSLSGIGVADAQAHQEAIELRFGQRIGAVVFDRILGGDHHEGTRQRVGAAVDGDLALVHGFEQRGLGFRRWCG